MPATAIALLLAACGGATPAANPTTAPGASTAAPATDATMMPAGTETMMPAGTTMPVGTETMMPAGTKTTVAGTAMPKGTMTPGTSGTMTDVDPAAFTGNILIAGSSTVFPLTQRMSERFKDEGFTGGQITIDETGTGGGFERFCKTGEIDIANASRPIKEEETANCAALGTARTPIEFRVGTDALAVVVSSENTFAKELTLAQLAQIFNGEAKTWADVDPSFPAEAIQLFSPGSDSGTYDYFVEEVLSKDDAKLQTSGAQFSENDNVLVQGVEGSQYAIGYFGYAYFNENKGKLRALTIDGVEPNATTAEDGSYPLARPLFIYSDAAIIKEKPQVGAFISFYLTYVNDEIGDVGYFPASDAALDEARNALMTAMQ